MPRHKSETALAWLTLFGTATHFVLETWYHLVWGQPLQALLVDYICVALMVSGGIASLKARPGSAAGLLAAGWAFALGFGWRSVFGRLQLREAGLATANGEAGWVVFIILGVLAVVAFVLLWALWLAWRQAGLIKGNRVE
jgi:hypothetical protein